MRTINGFADLAGGAVNRLLAPTGFMITRDAPGQAEAWRSHIGGPYRSDREVIALARQRGVSVADFIEEEWGSPGRARQIIEQLHGLGAVPADLRSVCEIGPGSGKYIQALFARRAPVQYEIYEIERHRAHWLGRTYPVVVRATDGERLSGTADSSMQLVHAHGVFASLKTISSLALFAEAMRITAPGGHVAFDIISEECLSDADVDAWLKTPLRYVNFLSKAFVTGYFERHGFSLTGNFAYPLMIFGRSVYLLFQKTSA